MLLLASGGAAQEQKIPNLVGTWKGSGEAVHIGPTPYRVPEHDGPNFPGAIEVTYVVKEQVGARFAGDVLGKFKETFIGMLRPPNFTSGIILDNDGQYEFTLRDEKTIDACYWHQYPTSKAIVCWTMTKQD